MPWSRGDCHQPQVSTRPESLARNLHQQLFPNIYWLSQMSKRSKEKESSHHHLWSQHHRTNAMSPTLSSRHAKTPAAWQKSWKLMFISNAYELDITLGYDIDWESPRLQFANCWRRKIGTECVHVWLDVAWSKKRVDATITDKKRFEQLFTLDLRIGVRKKRHSLNSSVAKNLNSDCEDLGMLHFLYSLPCLIVVRQCLCLLFGMQLCPSLLFVCILCLLMFIHNFEHILRPLVDTCGELFD